MRMYAITRLLGGPILVRHRPLPTTLQCGQGFLKSTVVLSAK
jgi:hypothetical protein